MPLDLSQKNRKKNLALFLVAVVAIFSLGFFQNSSSSSQFQSPQSKQTVLQAKANSQTSNPNPAPASIDRNAEPEIVRTDFMKGLKSPWDLSFFPDGTLLFTEKCRGLSVRLSSGAIHHLFGTSTSALPAKDFFCEGQSGMHGIAIDPNFNSNRYIYVFMPSKISSPKTNRVVRLKLAVDYKSVSNRQDIVTDIAYKNNANAWFGAGAHSGGRIRFGPDGYLYITTGDNHSGVIPQSPTILGGKVLRVDRNGSAAPGNKAPAGRDPRVFTLGHRNVQGISFDPRTAQAYIAEHGPGHSDEVTALVAGGNGGWDPAPEAGVQCNDNYCGYVSNKADGRPTPMTDLKKFPNALRPTWTNEGESEGICPNEFLQGPQWKAWNGRMAVGFLRGQRIEILKINADGTLAGTSQLNLPSERIRALRQGHDGNLYVATDSGNIWKVSPK